MPTATAAANSISSGDSVDARSGYCTATRSFRSLRPPVPLPPPEAALSFPAFALLLLPYSLPAHPALLDAATGEAFSFPAFVSQARALAAALRSRAGFARGDVAFVLAPARLDVPVLYFALLSLGAVVAPANPALTADEIARLVAVSGASVAFAVASTAAKLPAGVPAVHLDSDLFRSFLHHHSDDDDLAVVVRQSDTAAVQFSSGTTGRLKAAALPHRSFIAMTAGFHALFEKPTPGCERVLLSAPMFHSMGFCFALKAVATRKTMVLVTDAVARAGVKGVLAAAERWGVVEMTVAPPVVTGMAKERRSLGSLQRVICGGAPLSTAAAEMFERRFPNVDLCIVSFFTSCV
jgi:4-coumarate--CoA ligase